MWVMTNDRERITNIEEYEGNTILIEYPMTIAKPEEYRINSEKSYLGKYATLENARYALKLLAEALKNKKDFFEMPTEDEVQQLQEKSKEVYERPMVLMDKKEKRITNLKAGDRFEFKGYKWIVLDPESEEGGIFAIMSSPWNGKQYCFDKDDCNNYAKSTLRRKLLNELLPILGDDNLIPHEVDLVADNGDDAYGKITDKLFILSCDEYRKYRKNVPLITEWMLTCTPWYINPDAWDRGNVRVVGSAGYLDYYIPAGTYGILPACIFDPEKIKDQITIK